MKHKTLLFGMILVLIGLTIVHFSIKPDGDSLKDHTASDSQIIDAGKDKDMQKAFNRARKTLNDFFNIAKTQPEGTQGYSLKIGITQGEHTEFFWVYPFEETEEGFSARINNQPKIIDSVFKGEIVSFVRGQIVDWTYDNKEANTLHGNFTGCVDVNREAPDNAEQFMKLYGLNCDFLTELD
ncbi:MAG: DUF2314 domain-containing protein [Cellvibrionaceae bacterium]